MKNTAIIAAVFAGVFAVMYLMLAFATWNADPSHWLAEQRAAMAFATLLIGTFLSCVALGETL
jgi:hypothetical protein